MMGIEVFSENTLRILEKAGWYPGRSVPTDAFEALIAEYEFYINDTIRKFLQEFGGLCLEIHRTAPIINTHNLRFGIADEFALVGAGGADDYEKYIGGEKLAPVGHDFDTAIFMSFSGKMYWGYCGRLSQYRGDAYDTIEGVCQFYCRQTPLDMIVIHAECY